MSEESSNGFVTVACKHPPGIVLHLYEFIESQEPQPGGGYRKVKVARQLPRVHVLHGPATPFGRAPKVLVVDGSAINTNVPEDFWKKWCDQNKGCDLLVNKQLFSYGDTESVVDMSKDFSGEKSGLEPMEPEGDPRTPRKVAKANLKEA